jgi:hypothetical protein
MANRATTAVITAALAVAAVVLLGVRLAWAAGREDTDAIESTLILIVARQVTSGPGGLYGPFGSSNPLVLIHAPLYYRLAALLAWPLSRAGLDPVTAAMVAGRSLSFAGFVAVLALLARLASLEGGGRRAGLWSPLLLAGAPALAGFPVAVRPDMLGVALQTAGVVLVLEATGPGADPRAASRRVPAALALFAAACCVKQHFVATPAISLAVLLARRARGRSVVVGLLLGGALGGAYLAFEDLVSVGRMSTTLLMLPGAIGRVRPADWGRVEIIFSGLVFFALGPLAAAAACVVAAVRPGRVRVLVILLTTLAAAAFAGLVLLRRQGPGAWSEHGIISIALVALVGAALASIPADRRRLFGGRVDAVLWAYLIGELVVMALLCRNSSGAWINYAVQATAFACALLGRALARLAAGVGGWRAIALALGALAVPSSEVSDVLHEFGADRANRQETRLVVEKIDAPAGAVYFAGDPGANRVHGRRELVIDDWLYPVFESIGQAEPRALWLRRTLAEGPIRAIVTTNRDPHVAGVAEPLTSLGYRPDFFDGRRLYVWRRGDVP